MYAVQIFAQGYQNNNEINRNGYECYSVPTM